MLTIGISWDGRIVSRNRSSVPASSFIPQVGKAVPFTRPALFSTGKNGRDGFAAKRFQVDNKWRPEIWKRWLVAIRSRSVLPRQQSQKNMLSLSPRWHCKRAPTSEQVKTGDAI